MSIVRFTIKEVQSVEFDSKYNAEVIAAINSGEISCDDDLTDFLDTLGSDEPSVDFHQSNVDITMSDDNDEDIDLDDDNEVEEY